MAPEQSGFDNTMSPPPYFTPKTEWVLCASYYSFVCEPSLSEPCCGTCTEDVL